jgi:hypothetical protein
MCSIKNIITCLVEILIGVQKKLDSNVANSTGNKEPVEW